MSDGELQWLSPNDVDLTVEPLTSAGVDGWESTSTDLHVHDGHAGAVGYAAVLINPLGEAGPLNDLPAEADPDKLQRCCVQCATFPSTYRVEDS
jgi:hypothetical protein